MNTKLTTSSEKFHGLDHLRALAILLVFIFHYTILSKGEPSWLATMSSFGWTGVDLFFVLSGFLIALPLFKAIGNSQPISLRTFFIKRTLRILPVYWFTLLIYVLFPFFREKESLPSLLKFLTFTQNFGLNIKTHGTFSHAWSLCVEEHFYILFPFLLLWMQGRKHKKIFIWILPVLFVAGIGLRYYSYHHIYFPYLNDKLNWMYWYRAVYYPSYNRLDGILTGVGIAALYQFAPNFWLTLSRYANLIFVLGLFILTGAYFFCEDQSTPSASVWGFSIIAISYGCMVIASLCETCFLYRWQSKVSSFIAAISFSLYLTHKGITHCTQEVLSAYTTNQNVLFLVSFLSCLLFAWLLFQFLEKPCLRIRNQILQKRNVRGVTCS